MITVVGIGSCRDYCKRLLSLPSPGDFMRKAVCRELKVHHACRPNAFSFFFLFF